MDSTSISGYPPTNDPRPLHLLPGLAQCDVQVHLLLAAIDGDAHGVASPMVVHYLSQILLVGDFFVINRDDQVSAEHDRDIREVCTLTSSAQAGTFRSATGNHLNNQQSVISGQAHLFGELRSDGNGAHAQGGPPHTAQCHQVVEHGLRSVNRNGEADARTLPHAGGDHCINTDYLAMPIHKWTAGVARVDGSVCLDGFVYGHAIGLAHRADRTHNAACHGASQSEGVADGIDFLADLQISGVAQYRRGEVWRTDLNHCQIMRLIHAHNVSTVFLAVVQGDFDLARIGDDVVIGQDMAFFIDDETRALSFLGHESVEEIEGYRSGGDVHDRRDVVVVDPNVVLLFGVERLASRGFSDLNFVGTAQPISGPKPSVAVSCKVEEGAGNHHRKENRSQRSHILKPLATDSQKANTFWSFRQRDTDYYQFAVADWRFCAVS